MLQLQLLLLVLSSARAEDWTEDAMRATLTAEFGLYLPNNDAIGVKKRPPPLRGGGLFFAPITHSE